jgi:hypothetical protein
MLMFHIVNDNQLVPAFEAGTSFWKALKDGRLPKMGD